MTEFLATMRCDRCGSQAYFIMTKIIDGNELDLMTCAHHYRENADVFLIDGWNVEQDSLSLQAIGHDLATI